MIKEKHLPVILIISLLFSVAFIITGFITVNSEEYSPSEPEYVEKVFDKDSIINIDIQIDQEQWDYMIENALSEVYVPCDIVINGEKYQTVGIRPKGNSSLSMVAGSSENDRFSFRIDFSQYIKGQSLYGLSRMSLNNMIGDASYMKEYLSYEMFDEMGVNTPVYAYANITLNGEEWGLYLAVEIMEKDYLERNYGSNYGNLYKPDGSKMIKNDDDTAENKTSGIPMGIPQRPEGDFQAGNRPTPPMGMMRGNSDTGNASSTTMQLPGFPGATGPGFPPDMESGDEMRGGMMGKASNGTDLVYVDDNISSYSDIFDYTITKSTSDADKKRLISIIKMLNSGENLEESIDVDEVLRYFAVNTFLVNLDSYVGSTRHNYYLYEKDGVMEILPWDLNLSFGGFQMSDSSKVVNFPIDSPAAVSMETSPLISKLLEIEEYKEKYHEYLNEILEIYSNSNKYIEEIDNLNNLIGEYVENDVTSFFDYEKYQTAVEELKNYYEERSKSITAQLSGEQPSTEYGNMETDLNLQALGTMSTGDRENRDERNFMDFNGGEESFPMGEMPDMSEFNTTESSASGDGGALITTEVQKSSEDSLTNSTDTTTPFVNANNTPNQPASGNETQVMNSTNFSGLVTLAISFISIISGCLFTRFYKRKKFNS